VELPFKDCYQVFLKGFVDLDVNSESEGCRGSNLLTGKTLEK